MDVSRRDMLKGSAVLAAGLAATGAVSALGCSSAPKEEEVKDFWLPEAWDYEADVVIVGYGGAGAIAAITAADQGASVLVLEKYPDDTDTEVRHTPSTRSSGASMIGVTTKEEGSKAIYAYSMGQTPQDVCDAFAERACGPHYEYCASLGLNYEPPRGTGEYPTVYGGNGEIYTASLVGQGPMFMLVCRQNFEKRADQITVLWETPGKRLIKNFESGEICGVVASTPDGKEINVKARKAVALTTGGYEFNEDMLRHYLRVYPAKFYSNPNNTGDGIKMGQAVGAELINMSVAQGGGISYHKDWGRGVSFFVPEFPNFYVNKLGKRFWYDEHGGPAHGTWLDFSHLDTMNGNYLTAPGWFIMDAKRSLPYFQPRQNGYLGNEPDPEKLQYYPPSPEEVEDEDMMVEKGWVIRADTIEDLAAQMKADPENEGLMDVENLKETFARYNQYCVDGFDPEFNRDPESLEPVDTPPYVAFKVYPGGASTQGGLRRNGKGQVMDPYGEPIPRLYVAGENGGIWGMLYPRSGGNISDLVVFGWIIGEEMAAETPWDATA